MSYFVTEVGIPVTCIHDLIVHLSSLNTPITTARSGSPNAAGFVSITA